jgi:hypothetical protein
LVIIFEALIPVIFMEQVKLERESLLVARTKIAQVTAELKEKEAMLSAVKQDMKAEQENLLGKVRLFTSVVIYDEIHCIT